MQLLDIDFEGTLRRLASAELPLDLHARVVCSCRSRLYQASCTRRRSAVSLAAVWSLAMVAFGWAALNAHQRHVHLEANLYGG